MPIKLECPVRPGHEPTTVPDEQGLTLALLETFGVPDSKVEPHGRGAFNDVVHFRLILLLMLTRALGVSGYTRHNRTAEKTLES